MDALLSQCLDITKQLISAKQRATINIRIGSEFNFSFCNKEEPVSAQKKRTSPSQKKRSHDRHENYRHKKDTAFEKKIDVENCMDEEVAIQNSEEINEVEMKIEKKDLEAETKSDDSFDKETIWMDCWDPDHRWAVQDVSEHMEETLTRVFKVFKVDENDRKYELNISDKVGEMFALKVEFKKSKNLKAVIDNFRRDGNVKGGGCVKFIRIRKQELFY